MPFKVVRRAGMDSGSCIWPSENAASCANKLDSSDRAAQSACRDPAPFRFRSEKMARQRSATGIEVSNRQRRRNDTISASDTSTAAAGAPVDIGVGRGCITTDEAAAIAAEQ